MRSEKRKGGNPPTGKMKRAHLYHGIFFFYPSSEHYQNAIKRGLALALTHPSPCQPVSYHHNPCRWDTKRTPKTSAALFQSLSTKRRLFVHPVSAWLANGSKKKKKPKRPSIDCVVIHGFGRGRMRRDRAAPWLICKLTSSCVACLFVVDSLHGV